MDVKSLEQEAGKRPGTMRPSSDTSLEEYAHRAELPSLDLATAGELLQEHGYELVERFGHVHAAAGGWEWHVCLIADLASMSPSRFLACLDEARKQSMEHLFSHITQEEGAVKGGKLFSEHPGAR